ncbi:MAG: efflux RND transporter periplasmic adaptor subunit, partial [Gemmatimonadota bacterium]
MTKHRIGVVVAVVVLAGCGRGVSKQEPSSSVPPDLVALDSAQVAAAGITLGTVQALPPDTIHLTGTITFDASRVSHVGPRAQGRIRRVYVEIGTRVAAGDTLALLDGPELGSAQARATQAQLARDVASRNYERAERLYRDGIVSQRRRLEAEAEFRNREAEFAAREQELSLRDAQDLALILG